MRFATWNIYWLGYNGQKINITRTAQDEALIAQILATVAADVLALQEIVDPLILERILQQAAGPGRDFVIRSPGGAWLTPNPHAVTNDWQKVFLCINQETIEFVRGATIRGGPPNRPGPFAAHLHHRTSGAEFVVVAVHLKSGQPDFLNSKSAKIRASEAQAAARWLRGEAADENPEFPIPQSGNILLLGDFNALLDDPNQSLAALGPEGLPGWIWREPTPDGAQYSTSIVDDVVIDFIMFAPDLTSMVVSPPAVYAWDHDATLGGPARFHEGPNGTGSLKNYKVSDHRPVVVDVRIGD